MSDDPETLRQIRELALDTRPLLVLDVDDVILEFMRPFMRYLDTQGLRLALDSFRLHGNIRHLETDEPADKELVDTMISSFFEIQSAWQTLLADAAPTIEAIAGEAEIVLLTAMPHRFRAQRRALLDTLGLPYPLVTTEKAKGPALKALRGDSGRAVAFVDDIPHNHQSVQDTVPDAHLFHLMAMPELDVILPALPDGVTRVNDWNEAGPKIARALGLTASALDRLAGR